MPARSFKLNLNAESSDNLRALAAGLGLTETEVIRKAILLMSLYEKARRTPGGALVVREGGKDRELLIV